MFCDARAHLLRCAARADNHVAVDVESSRSRSSVECEIVAAMLPRRAGCYMTSPETFGDDGEIRGTIDAAYCLATV
jgi:hypothetical protein